MIELPSCHGLLLGQYYAGLSPRPPEVGTFNLPMRCCYKDENQKTKLKKPSRLGPPPPYRAACETASSWDPLNLCRLSLAYPTPPDLRGVADGESQSRIWFAAYLILKLRKVDTLHSCRRGIRSRRAMSSVRLIRIGGSQTLPALT